MTVPVASFLILSFSSSMASASAAAAASSTMARATEKAVRRRAADVGSAALRFVDAALKDADMYAKLTLVAGLTNQMDFLIKESSRNDSVYSTSLIKDIQGLGAGLWSATEDCAYFVDPVLAMLGDSCSLETEAVLSGYAATAVKNMVNKFRHVEDWSDTLRMKVGHSCTAHACRTNIHCTCMYIHSTHEGHVGSSGAREMLMEPGRYWRTKEAIYPLLYKLGLWFASIPLSAVAAESAIGLMREIETPKRNRIKEPSWQAENFLRYNKWLAQLEFDDVLRQVNATEAGIRSRNPAAAAAAAATVNAAPF